MSTGINGFGTGMDRDMFNAQLVTQTMNKLNNTGNGMGGMDMSMAPVDKATGEASLVTGTLNTLNSDPNDMGNSFQFQTRVLGAFATGSLINKTG